MSHRIIKTIAFSVVSVAWVLAAGGATITDNAPPPSEPLSLWYKAPAAVWTEALAIGNGRLGAMVFGGLDTERLQINEDTFWSGQPHSYVNTNALNALPYVRNHIFNGEFQLATSLFETNMMGRPKIQCSFEPAVDLNLTTPLGASVSQYRRDLNLDTATASVTYQQNGVTYLREVFSSPVDNVLVLRISASQTGKVAFTANLSTKQTNNIQVSTGTGNTIVLSGDGASGPNSIVGLVKFEGRLRIIPQGGTLSTNGGSLTVTNADSAVLLLDVGTSFINYHDISGDPTALTTARIAAAAARTYAAMAADHVAEHRRLMRRVAFDLGTSAAAQLPTNERLTNFAANVYDPQLVPLYYQFGRYLLISCSRPGTQPANLQGLWNDDLQPDWGSKYTIDINTEMNYWPAEVANLGELTEPLKKMLEDLTVTGAEIAQKQYGADGWVTHHNTDIWRGAAPVDAAFYGAWPMGGAWLSTHLWEHYQFSLDTNYLAEVYPILKGASEFFVDYLVDDTNSGFKVTCPSLSPEHQHHGSPMVSICAGPSVDMSILRDLFDQTARSAEILGVDAAFRTNILSLRSQLAPLKIGAQGQLQEWQEDWDATAPDPQHRHISHLYALYPGNQIDVRQTPALAAAAATSLTIRGDISTGWAIAWRLNCWARLHEGDHTLTILKALLDPTRTYPNLFDAHPPFQIDGNFGGVAGITEMLLQSQAGEIELLPSLPSAWTSGSISGLCARGAFEVDVSWSNGGQAVRATIRSVGGTNAVVRYGNDIQTLAVPLNGSAEYFYSASATNATYEWDAGAGANRDWSNGTNWTGNLEPASTNTAYVNGGYTGVIAQAGARAAELYIGSTNQPSNGANSTGRVEQTGGDLVISTNLHLGKYKGGVGSYWITNGTLTVTNVLFVGNQGLGTMLITNTASVSAKDVVIGNVTAAVAATSGSRLTLGRGSLGVAGYLFIAGNNVTDVGSDGTYEQFGGAATIAAAVRVANNDSATGLLTMAGGSFNARGAVQIGNYLNSRGRMTMSGSSTTRVTGITTLGRNVGAVGSLAVSGGLFVASGSMNVGEAAGSTGILAVAGGALVLSNSQLRIGDLGNGTATLSGGAVTAGTVMVSFGPNAAGALTVAGGRLVATNVGESLTLRRRSAVVNVSGGIVEANGIVIGTIGAAGTPATLQLSGGVLIGGRSNGTAASNDFYIAQAGGVTGLVNITGGLLDLSRANNDLILGQGTNALGILTLGGGTATVAGVVQVGTATARGNGQLFVSNGLFNIARTLSLPVTAGSTASVTQVGGIVKVGGNLTLGNENAGGVGRYVIRGGTLTNAGNLLIGHASSGTGSLEVVGGAPAIRVGTNLTLASRGELRCTLSGTSLAPIYVGKKITAAGTLFVTNTGTFAPGTYLVATSVSRTAISGKFAKVTWPAGVTGTVAYANNRITFTITSVAAPAKQAAPSVLAAAAPDAQPTTPQPHVTVQNGSPKPNILVILADDLGYADVGFNGCPDIPTPNIDALATQGIVFANGYVSHSVCSPSRAGLLTGRYQQRFGRETNPTNEIINALEASELTIGNVLTNAGYKAIAVGKWHLGSNNPNQPPNRGFSDFVGILGGGAGTSYFNVTLRRDFTSFVETNYLTHAFTREAMTYITSNAASATPFFLYLAYNAPHVPLSAPQDYLDRFASITDATRQTHAAMVSALDDGIGQVLQSLETNGIATNTLVYFLSDNGGPTAVTTASNDPLRGVKGQIFEGGVHVPFVMRWTGRLPAGTNYAAAVSALDIFPTAVALAGASLPSDRTIDGVNLMPFLLGQTNGVPHDHLFWRQGDGESWAVLESPWKWLYQSGETGPLLAQLAADGTGEYTDLSTGETARVASLENIFSAWDEQMLDPFFGEGEVQRLNGATTVADTLGYRITTTNTAMSYVLTTHRHPPNPASNFIVRFSMDLISVTNNLRNGYVVLGETTSTSSMIRAGISYDQSRLLISELETGGSNFVALAPADLPVGTNAYELTYDRSANSLTLHLGTNLVTRTLSRLYGTLTSPGYALQQASTRFSVLTVTQSFADISSPTYEWDAGAGADRSWSSSTNWVGNSEPTSLNFAYVNGSYTAVVAQAGERAAQLYVGSTNAPSDGANATGRVEQIGGDLVVCSNMFLGKYAGGGGSYWITNGTLTVSNKLFVGDQGLGTFVMTNAANVTSRNDLVIGNGGEGAEVAGSRFTLGGGTLSISTYLMIAGEIATDTNAMGADGLYEQLGGSSSVGITLRVGNNVASTGRLVLAGGSLSVGLNLHVGNIYTSRGYVAISGASTMRVAGATSLGRNQSSFGSLTVSGGLFVSGGDMNLGEVATSTGIVVLTDGSIVLSNSELRVGDAGIGDATISGGAVTSATVVVGFGTQSVGTLTLSGGRLVATNAGESLTLRRRAAMMNVSGGTVEANGVSVGTTPNHNFSAGPATLNLSGGTLLGGRDNSSSITNDFYIGGGPAVTGVVNITGGLLDLSRSNNDLILGRGTNAMGILTMDGGTCTVGGAVRVGALVVADPELTGNGQLYITNGLLDVGGSMNFPISSDSTALVSQVGGVVRVTANVTLGYAGSGGVGRYVLSGGTLTNAGALLVGQTSNGSGYFEVVGGVASIRVGSFTNASRGELRSTFQGAALSPIYVANAIAVGGTLSITNTGAYAAGTFVIATSLTQTAVSGTFATTNWLNGLTGTVSYADNRVAVSFATVPDLVGVPSDATASCDSVPGPASVTATNGCGTPSTVLLVETTNAGPCANSYQLIRVWSASNTCGYSASATQILTVADTTAPDLTCPADTNVVCEVEADPARTGFAAATDNCDPAPVVSHVDSPGAGAIVRTWTAVDACGNSNSCVQTIALDTSGTDTDHDGVSDYDECMAGTSPTNDQSYLRLRILPGLPVATLAFTTSATRVYAIEYEANLTNGVLWPVLTNLPGTGGDLTVQDSNTVERRFYRLKAQLSP